ncbi:hypothetical protein ACSSS7_001755 [Eimeria intestinalis]
MLLVFLHAAGKRIPPIVKAMGMKAAASALSSIMQHPLEQQQAKQQQQQQQQQQPVCLACLERSSARSSRFDFFERRPSESCH